MGWFAAPFSRLRKRIAENRRLVRWGLVGCNLALLAGIGFFTLYGSGAQDVLTRSAVLASGDTNPVDQLSSAEIAANIAMATALPEVTGVINNADSATAELAVAAADTTAVAKTQLVATTTKTRNDIQEYIVQPGDTVASIAARFNVTSDSVMLSNNLRSTRAPAGTILLIPPIDGVIYIVQAGDTPDKLASRFRTNAAQIIAFNDVELTGLTPGERIVIPGGRQPFVAVFSANGYDYGFCTWYAANRRAQLGRPIPSNFGDAWTWDDRAIASGIFTVNREPGVGAIAVTSSNRRPGHVAIVEAINADGSIWISEMNSRGQVSMTNSTPTGGWGKVDWKIIPADQARTINYIH